MSNFNYRHIIDTILKRSTIQFADKLKTKPVIVMERESVLVTGEKYRMLSLQQYGQGMLAKIKELQDAKHEDILGEMQKLINADITECQKHIIQLNETQNNLDKAREAKKSKIITPNG